MNEKPLVCVTKLLNQVTTGSQEYALSGKEEYITITVTWGPSTSAGVIHIEESDEAGFPGTWSVITTVSWDTANSKETVHLVGSYKNLRTRVSTTVTGGFVSTSIYHTPTKQVGE